MMRSTVVLLLGLGTAPAIAAYLPSSLAVGPQYDTTHVYVAPADVDRFVQSFIATFGGESTKQVVLTVTPHPSPATSQLIHTPVGAVSLFGFTTGIPYPFGAERGGYLVRDMDKAVAAARKAGADRATIDRVRRDLEAHLDVIQAREEEDEDHPTLQRHDATVALELALVRHKAATLLRLRDDDEIDDVVLRQVRAGYDAEEARLEGSTPA